MFCEKCGTENDDSALFCSKCGTSLKGNRSAGSNSNIPANYKPITMWGYFGYEILFSIPVVGFILLIIYSFGGKARNKNLKNFARSYFCYFILLAILAVIWFVTGHNSGVNPPLYY